MTVEIWNARLSPVLASSSATRRQLLASVGIEAEPVAPKVEERAIEQELLRQGASPVDVARELARAKAQAVSHLYPGRWVIAADQTLSAGGEQFHKPAGAKDAARQLQALAGRTHDLHAAVCCSLDGKLEFDAIESAHMSMRTFSEEFLSDYLALAGPAVTSSVGGYQVEGLGLHLFEKIEGAHSTILGLPLLPLLAFFRSVGVLKS